MTLAPCIYYRSDTPHHTKEHVLQAGFVANIDALIPGISTRTGRT